MNADRRKEQDRAMFHHAIPVGLLLVGIGSDA
jgi:hypothetical protein